MKQQKAKEETQPVEVVRAMISGGGWFRIPAKMINDEQTRKQLRVIAVIRLKQIKEIPCAALPS